MLEVSTFLAPSNIQGIGLFATNKICKGEIIWRYDSRTTISYSKREWDNLRIGLPEIAFENIWRFVYFQNGKWKFNLDDVRFMNHSEEPNLRYDKIKDLCYAMRDINAGEELTVMYSEFCDESETCKVCKLCSKYKNDEI